MFRLTRTGLLAAAMIANSQTFTAEIEDFTVESELTYGYAVDANTSIQGELQVSPRIDLTLGNRASMIASALIRLDAQDELEPGRRTFENYAPATRPANLGNAGTAEIRDFYWELRSAKGLTRLGKQQVVWGRLDGIKVLDLVNPQDFREFIIEDFGDSRIGLWSAYFDYSFESWRTELVIVPDGSGHGIPDTGAWYELTAPRFRFGASPGQAAPTTITDAPGHSLDDTAFGFRLSRRVAGADISLVGYSGLDPEPLGRLSVNNGEPAVERYFERRDAFGLSFDLNIGSTVVRAEYAFQPGRSFNTRSNDRLAALELDQHRGAIGIDFNGPMDIFINIQYLVDTISDAPAELIRPASDRIGTVYLRRSFAYDALAVEARWYQSFTDHDRFAYLGVTYAINDNSSIALGAEHYNGTADGLFGQFEERGRIAVSFSHEL